MFFTAGIAAQLPWEIAFVICQTHIANIHRGPSGELLYTGQCITLPHDTAVIAAHKTTVLK
jgi:predicted NAD/FAD-binding protein